MTAESEGGRPRKASGEAKPAGCGTRPPGGGFPIRDEASHKPSKPRVPRGRRGPKTDKQVNQATANEFEREGMGVAPKE